MLRNGLLDHKAKEAVSKTQLRWQDSKIQLRWRDRKAQ